MRQLFFVLGFLIAITTTAQSQKHKSTYYAIPQLALLNGDKSVSAQVQLTAGLQKDKWMFGLGAAVDYYKIRTVPVFADVRYLVSGSRKLFGYANIGASIPWALESQHTDHYTTGAFSPDKFSAGLYTDMGIGYSFHGDKPGGMTVSLGYSVKKLTNTYDESVYREFPPYILETRRFESHYTLNRIALKLGVRL